MTSSTPGGAKSTTFSARRATPDRIPARGPHKIVHILDVAILPRPEFSGGIDFDCAQVPGKHDGVRANPRLKAGR